MAERARQIDCTTSMTRRQFVRRTGKAALGLIILSHGGILSGCGKHEHWRHQLQYLGRACPEASRIARTSGWRLIR